MSNNKGFFSQVAGSLQPHMPRRPGRGDDSPGRGDPSLPNAIFFEHCTAEGEALTQAFPKQTGRFVIRARDRLFRQTAQANPSPFTWSFAGARL